MRLTEKEIAALYKLDAYERYKYFIKRVADSELLYTLVDGSGEFVLADIESKTVFSVWCAAEFALLNATGKWFDFTVREVTLEEFQENIVDKIENERCLINVFSLNEKSGFVVDIDELARDLSEELKKYH